MVNGGRLNHILGSLKILHSVKQMIWDQIKAEVLLRIEEEKSLKDYFQLLILSQVDILSSVASILASKLQTDALKTSKIKELLLEALQSNTKIIKEIEQDLLFFKNEDPACHHLSTPLLFYKGFLGLACYRASHALWINNRKTLALFFQNRASEVLGIDIHPAAKIAGGIMIDHATGVVIGETCTIESKVSIFQGVTIGGKGNESGGKRHPSILEGASIFASSTILGDILVGKNAVVAAGSLVLKSVQENETVAGIPARRVRGLRQNKAEWDPGDSSL